jgi:PTS system fructose-specific IIC component
MLAEVMGEDLVIAGLKSKEKEDAIREMALRLKQAGVIKDENAFIEAIIDREKIESTAVGEGIAIPHARSDTVDGLAVVFARCEEGIDFESVDGKPVRLVFMIACAPEITKGYLQILARIARLCKNGKMKDALLKARDGKEVMGLIKSFDAGSGTLEEVKLKKGRTVYSNNETDQKM